MVELFENSGDPYQMPHVAASDLGLHCLPITDVGVSVYNGSKWSEPLYCTILTYMSDLEVKVMDFEKSYC